MMKTISLLLVITVCIQLNAQETDMAFATARYSFVHISDTTQPDNPLKENTILYLGKNMSFYTGYDRIERAAKLKAGAGSETMSGSSIPATAIMNGKIVDPRTIDASTIISVSVSNGQMTIEANPAMALRGSYYKNLSTSVLSYIAFAGKMFTVDENIPVIDWSIKSETKEILAMPCQKAIGDFKGRTYEAWFCSQLPYSNGPWKLGGLPGLILEAYDTKKEVMFNFISFENVEGEPVSIGIPSDVTKTTPKEFKQYQEAMTNGRAGMSGGGVVVGGSSSRSGAPAPRLRKMNNPIEKETVK